MKIKNEWLPYILMQRTEYLKTDFKYKVIAKLLSLKGLDYYHSRVRANVIFNSKAIKLLYEKDMYSEYNTIKEVLPISINNILDIGCGIAGVDVYISNHYNNSIDIYLLDKTLMENKVHYGFEQKGAFYNSLEGAKDFLISNSIKSDKIFIQEATDDNKITFDDKFDLIISLISWGFHYPVSTYLNEVYNKLSNNGILIIDVRKETDGIEKLKEVFPKLEVVFDSSKFQRILARKQ